ncbi:Patulin cluster transcription factor patL [Lasiodiplodia hormozganensis]|uniref:Patulin cluster transcription factor patL n=1 Tax=Lasiodiplodia hormozganensis TaxID=869390 RepID=A0AA40CVX8_9PEZI|nr:Patulin cluster transcription factor patL [Lasiodiplodia hormozganensis]
MGLVCHYRTPARPVPQTAKDEQVARMEGRLQAMEAMLKAALGGASAEHTNYGAAPTEDDHSRTFINITTPVSIEDIQPVERGPGSTRDTDCISSAGEAVDGMAAISFRDEEGSGYFGPSSNSSLFNLIMAAAAEVDENHPSPTDSTVKQNLISRPTSPPFPKTGGQHVRSDNSCTLPPEYEIIDMVERFFGSTGQLFPYLHKPTILKSLASMRMSGFQNVKRSQLCILNLIMALACVFGTHHLPITERVDKGNVFLSRGLVLLQQDLAKSASLESLQALVLLVQYFEGTQSAAQTWKLHGTAVNVGLQLGLQQPMQAQCSGPLEAEIRRRTWWACFMMDRMCSMTFGRPPLIANNLMCCGLPSDVDIGQWEDNEEMLYATQNARKPLAKAFFSETSKLNLLVGNVISKIYQDNVKHDPDLTCTEILQETIKLEKQLMEWRQALPSPVQLISLQDIDSGSNNHRSRIVLTLRYLNTRTLLHRGVVTQFLRVSAGLATLEGPELSLLRSYGLNSLETCSETAINSIDIICRVANNESLLPVWWVSIYYGRPLSTILFQGDCAIDNCLTAFNSALILFGIIVVLHKHRMHLRQTRLHDLLDSVTTACKVLPTIGGGSHLVMRCQKILNSLMQTASSLDIGSRQGTNNFAAIEYIQPPAEAPAAQVPDRLLHDFHSQITDAIFFPSLDINSTFGFSSFDNECL